jgi:hypothetical protein
MDQPPAVDRAWIAAEFAKGIAVERALAAQSTTRAASPPDPALSILYHEIATADERHVGVLETIATRYGHTPARAGEGGFGRAWARLKESVGEVGASVWDQLMWDLAAKAQAAHWLTTWIDVLKSIGDTESARELSTILAEEETHRTALQQGLTRMVERRARNGDAVPS